MIRRHQPAALNAALALALLATVSVRSAEAQIGRIRRAAQDAARELPNPARLLEAPPPITTNLGDARWAVDSLDTHTPDPSVFKAITDLQRAPNGGGWVLQPGHYAYQSQSYCLKAGTHGPGGGDGYLFAPPAGPAEDQVVSIIRNSEQHPDIPQRSVQVLLWAIIAHAKFEDLSPSLKATAARLLTPQQIATLNRSALDVIPDEVLERAIRESPPLVQQAFRAEAQLRRMLATTDHSFDQLERAAVLAGLAPRGAGSRDVPSGRWSLHPDGYYVRYIPSGYSSTRVEIWVIEGSPGVGREFRPWHHIAVPGNTARQRLIQSARMHS